MNGISITIILGKYGGFYVFRSPTTFRICLGFIAFTIYNYDLDKKMEAVMLEHNLSNYFGKKVNIGSSKF